MWRRIVPKAWPGRTARPLGQDVPTALRDLKPENGPDLLIQGSSELIQTLLKHDLIDRFQLLIMPLVLGRGKRLFGDGACPRR